MLRELTTDEPCKTSHSNAVTTICCARQWPAVRNAAGFFAGNASRSMKIRFSAPLAFARYCNLQGKA
jgi:hypothetical protein